MSGIPKDVRDELIGIGVDPDLIAQLDLLLHDPKATMIDLMALAARIGDSIGNSDAVTEEEAAAVLTRLGEAFVANAASDEDPDDVAEREAERDAERRMHLELMRAAVTHTATLVVGRAMTGAHRAIAAGDSFATKDSQEAQMRLGVDSGLSVLVRVELSYHPDLGVPNEDSKVDEPTE